jgi:hypothetical protein
MSQLALTGVHVVCLSTLMWTKTEHLIFSVRFGLRKGLRLVRGMRALTDDEQIMIAQPIVKDLQLNNWKFEEGPPAEGYSRIIGGGSQ